MSAPGWIARWGSPLANPVLRREVRALGRRGRFGWVLFVLTLAMTLVIASVGARASAGVHPALLGKVLFQTFFGIAQALVLFAGPAVAAGSVAGEREGRTFEALLLTGMSPARIARGKTLAAVAHVGAYAIALAPVGAMPFLFGGVPATSALLAYAMLAAETVVATLVGLAISTRVPSTRAALIASVAAGAGMALLAHYGLGEALGDAVCGALNVARPGTVWLPVLVSEGGPAAGAAAAISLALLGGAGMASWFLYEACAASLSDPGADKARGLKRWFAASVGLYVVAAVGAIAAAPTRGGRAGAALGAVAAYVALASFAALVFQGDALVPPRRLRKLWAARGASPLHRFFGPGLNASAALQLGAAAVALGAAGAAGVALTLADDFGPVSAPLGVVAAVLPAGAMVLFVIGYASFARVRWGAAAGRTVLALLLLVLTLAPYALSAVFNGGELSPDAVGLFAPPSPVFLFDVAARVAQDTADAASVTAAVVSAVAYGVLGLATLVLASVGVDKMAARDEAEADRVDALLADEDAGRAPPPRTSVAPPGPFALAPRASVPPPAPPAAAPALQPTREAETTPEEREVLARWTEALAGEPRDDAGGAEGPPPEPARRAEKSAAPPATAVFASPPSAAQPAPHDARASEVRPERESAPAPRPAARAYVAYTPRESPFAAPPQIPVERPPPRPRESDDEERIAERAIPVDMDLIPEPDDREVARKRGSGGGGEPEGGREP